MSLSRGIHLFKAVNALRKPTSGHLVQQTRHSGDVWSYRDQVHPASKFQFFAANVVQGYMWWWILWHLWHEPEHLYGEFPYPDPKAWTNEELGIPPDDADV